MAGLFDLLSMLGSAPDTGRRRDTGGRDLGIDSTIIPECLVPGYGLPARTQSLLDLAEEDRLRKLAEKGQPIPTLPLEGPTDDPDKMELIPPSPFKAISPEEFELQKLRSRGLNPFFEAELNELPMPQPRTMNPAEAIPNPRPRTLEDERNRLRNSGPFRFFWDEPTPMMNQFRFGGWR